MASIYKIISSEANLNIEFLEKNKLLTLFNPILETTCIGDLILDEKDHSDLIRMIVYAFSPDSDYIKSKLDLFVIFDFISDSIELKKELLELIKNFSFNVFVTVANNYLYGQDPDFRVLKTAQLLYEEFISKCTTSILKSNGEVDYETKKYLFDQSLKLKDTMYELEQKAEKDRPEFEKAKTTFKQNAKSLFTEDLLSSQYEQS